MSGVRIRGYQGAPDGPRSPATPGGYCLTRCLCGSCPQYAEQRAQVAVLREQEYQARLRVEGERAAARLQHTNQRRGAA